MSEAVERWVDAAIGETREALVRGGKVVALRVMRASDEGRRARWGERYVARVRDCDRRRRGAFLDLGLTEEGGFLPFEQDGRVRLGGRERVALTEGQGVVVAVTREAARGKSPVVELQELGRGGEPARRIGRHECDDDLESAKPAALEIRAKLDAAIEDALAATAPIPGGGLLIIDPTAALVAIDVDAGARSGSPDPERFAFDLNVAAAREAAHQVRLRNLGGVIAIDFVSMRSKNLRAELELEVRAAFAGDPWAVQFGALSRFGVFELARAQLRAPLHEQMRGAGGRLSAETLAWATLRSLEREAEASTGRHIVCIVAPEILNWLDACALDWRAALSNRIGMRWKLEAAAMASWPRDKIDVRAL